MSINYTRYKEDLEKSDNGHDPKYNVWNEEPENEKELEPEGGGRRWNKN